jgi:hypothetical protein
VRSDDTSVCAVDQRNLALRAEVVRLGAVLRASIVGSEALLTRSAVHRDANSRSALVVHAAGTVRIRAAVEEPLDE